MIAQVAKEREILARTDKTEGRFARTMNDADKAAVPFNEKPPIVYPDKKTWKDSATKRKKKYSSMDLAKSPEGEERGGSAKASPDANWPCKMQNGLAAGPTMGGTSEGCGFSEEICPESRRHPQPENRRGPVALGADQVLQFHSLGVEPSWSSRWPIGRRLSASAGGWPCWWACSAWPSPGGRLRKKTAFILAVAVLATIVPLAPAASRSPGVQHGVLCRCVVAPYYLVVGALWTMLAWAGDCMARVPRQSVFATRRRRNHRRRCC